MSNRLFARCLFLCTVLFSLAALPLAQAQCCGAEPTTFTQPDGTELEIHFHGNERYTRTVSADGYTLIFDHAERAYYYADLDPTGDALVSTGRVAQKVKPANLNIGKNLELNPEARRRLADQRGAELEAVRKDKEKWQEQKQMMEAVRAHKKKVEEGAGKAANESGTGGTTETDGPEFAPPSNPPTLGNVLGLTILVDFPDVPSRPTVTRADFDDYCNKPGGRAGWGNKGSIYDYFYAQSNGRLRYRNNVTYYVRVPNPYTYYNDTSVAQNSGSNGRKLLTDALNVLVAEGYDFSGLSANAQGRVIATNLLWAGNSSGVWASGLWPHRWSLSTAYNVGGGLAIFDYQCTHIGSSGNPTIGTFCHENGHLVGKYPDYYDTNGGSSGVGNHCLMGGGNHATQTNPTNISSYLKFHSGWMDAIELKSLTPPIRLAAAVDGTVVYKYTDAATSLTNEYFMIENRSKVGGWESTSGLPDSGLMISHLHHSGSNQNEQRSESQHYEFSIEQADGVFDLETGADSGDANDYFHSGGTAPKTEFNDTTLPNAKWWKGAVTGDNTSGTDSGLSIHSVSAAGAVMSFVYGTGTPSGAAATRLTTSILENAADFGATAPNQTFAVYNSGGGTVNYTITDNVSWLAVNPASGDATTETDTITVSYTTSALAAGTYNGTITVNGGAAGTQTIAVTLTIRNQPTLSVTPASITVPGIAGVSGFVEEFDLKNTGGGTATYTITKTQSWLTLFPASGTVGSERDTIGLTCNASALAAGTYNDTITVTAAGATNSPLTIPVSFVVDPSDMILTAPNGGENWLVDSAQNITWASSLGGNVKIELLKGGALDTTIAASTPNDGSYTWLVPGGQPAGTDYKIRITSVESPIKTDASFNNFTISQDLLALALDTSGLTWSTTASLPWFRQTTTTKDGVDAAESANITHGAATSMETTIVGPGTMTFWWKVSSESGYDFLRFHLNGVEQTGSLARISGNIDWVQKTVSIPTGSNVVKWTYDKDGSVDGGSDTAWVDLVVYTPNSAPEIAVEQPAGTDLTDGSATADFGSVNTGSNTSLTFTIRNTGTNDLTAIAATLSGANSADYSVTTPPATSVAPGGSTTCVVRFAPGAPGTRAALLQIASNDANENPFDINLTGTGTGPGSLSVAGTDGLTSSGNIGGLFSPNSIQYTLSNPGSTSINWTATNTQSWVSLTAAGGTLAAGASANVTVSINPAAYSLAANTYNDTVTFTNTTNGSGNTTRPVALTVNTPPVVNAGNDQTIILTGSSWSPTEVSLGLWLDASDDATVILNGSNVSQWSDKSGFSRHATAIGTAQPAATPSGMNGKRVLTFNGSSHVMNVDLDFLAGINHSSFVVTKPTIYSNIYGAANGSAGSNSLHVGFSSATNYRMNYWANDFTPAVTANFVAGSGNIMNYVWTTGTGKQILANGKSEGTNTNAGVIGTMSGGGRIGRTTGHAFFGGDIAEFIAVTGSVSTTDREKMEGYLAHKWGLADKLGASHPYKAASPNSAEAVANLDGTTSDADGNSLTRTWSLVNGPAAVTFGNASADDTTATFITTGIYTLRLAVNDGFTQVTDDVVITVDPAPTGFTVKYNGNGNTGGSVPTDTTNYSDGATVTVLGNTGSLTRAGYTFAGWNTSANGSGTTYAPGATFSISANVNLYAMWTGLPYTVTFNKQSGTGGSNNVSATMGSAMPVATAPTRTGYTFAGYFTLIGGAGTQYYTAAMQSARNWDIAQNTTLHAHWTANNYTVTFIPNGGDTPSPTTQSVTYNSTYGTLATVNRTGYTFNGWFTAASGGSLVSSTTTVTTAADHNLHAQWSVSTYIVGYNANGATSGSAPSNQTKTYGVDLTLASNSGGLSRIGYTFAGWNTAADGSGTSYAVNAPYTANEAATLYARWLPISYTVTFDANGGEAPSIPNKSVTYDAVYGTLATTTRLGYGFTGWFTAAQGGEMVDASSIVGIASDHTLYAQWIQMAPEIDITRDAVSIPSGGYDVVGSTNVSVETKLTYAIANMGNANLTLSNAVISAQSNCTVGIDAQPTSTVAPYQSGVGLLLGVTPAASGAWSFRITIPNNDPNENPYQWTVHGVTAGISSVSLTAVADTYIDANSTGANNGGATTFSIFNRTSGPNSSHRYGLLKFDLSPIASGIPANANIVSASIGLVQNNNKAGLVDIVNVTNAWTEATTWATAAANLVGSTSYGSDSAPGTVNGAVPAIIMNNTGLDVVRGWHSGSVTNNGFGVKTTNSANNTNIDLHSREASNSAHRPKLNVSYAVNPQVPEIEIVRQGTTVVDGATDNVSGSVAGQISGLTYVIANLGNANLTLTTPVSVSSATNCTVSVISQPANAVSPSNDTVLVLNVTPTAVGAWSVNLSVTNNDADESLYNWTISGTATGGIVNTPPTISNIADQSTNEDTATSAIAFTIGDAETAAASLTVSGSSSNTTLVPNANIVFGGSGASRTVTVTPVANQSGTSTITVTVGDGSLTATDTFVLTVNYRVAYNGNGNTGGTAPSDQGKVQGVDLVLSGPGTLALTGYTFANWNTAADGSGTTYAAGATYSADASVTLYAQWTSGADGTWIRTATGPFDWGEATNWDASIVASGSDRTAYFTPDIGATQTVNLESPRTIGNITFTDSTTNSNNLTISGANILTLSRSSGIPAIDVTQSNRTLTISSRLDGNGGFTKNGAGTLVLGNASNGFSGDVSINAGTLNFTAAGSLPPNQNFVFTGNSTLTIANAVTPYTGGNITVNPGIAGLVSASTGNSQTYATATSGSNTSVLQWTGNGNSTLTLNDVSGFTGNLRTGSGSSSSPTMKLGNLIDSSGYGNLQFGGTNNGTATFELFNMAEAFIMANRSIEIISGSTTATPTLANNQTNAAHTWTINSALINGATGSKTLTFGGSNPGANTFAGGIANGSGTIALAKKGAGRWDITGNMSHTGGLTVTEAGVLNISGTNTYGGTTTVGTGTGSSHARLVIQGAQALSANTSFTLVQNSTPAFTLKLLNDTPGTVNLPNNVVLNVANSSMNGTIFVGNNHTDNGGTGSSLNTGTTLIINKLSSINSGNNRLLHGFRAEGANGYTLGIKDIEYPAFPAATFTTATNWTYQLIANTAPIKITGTVQQLAGSTSTTLLSPTLELNGTNTGSSVTGQIMDSADGTPRALRLTKAGSGTWTLSGDNSYTGTTTISLGKLFIDGDQSLASGAVTVGNTATLGGRGKIGGHTTISSGGKLEFDISSPAASHNPLDIAAGKDFIFSGTSSLTITSSAGAAPGIYTLVTGGNPIGGAAPVPANVVLPGGWSATVSISGNSLILNVSSTGSITPGSLAITGAGGLSSSGIAGASFSPGSVVYTLSNPGQDSINWTASKTAGWVTLDATGGTLAGGQSTNVTVAIGGTATALGAGAYNDTVTFTNTTNGTGNTTRAVSLTVISVYQGWANGYLPADLGNPSGNNDGDNLTNFQEFAFGMNPTSPALGRLAYVPNGTTIPGLPILENTGTAQSPVYRAVFPRRTDHVMAGISYQVQFSADLARWTASATAPVKLSGENADPVETMAVPFPATVPLQGGGSATPQYFRVGTSQN